MANHLLPFLLILLTITQCQRSEVLPQEVKVGEAFVLEQGEQLQLADTQLELEVKEVSDSRCPEDVVCVWYGNAAVKLKVYGSSGRAQMLSLCIGDCKPEPPRNKHTLTAEVNGQAYEITLLDVLPIPNTKHQDAAKQVKLLVNKLN